MNKMTYRCAVTGPRAMSRIYLLLTMLTFGILITLSYSLLKVNGTINGRLDFSIINRSVWSFNTSSWSWKNLLNPLLNSDKTLSTPSPSPRPTDAKSKSKEAKGKAKAKDQAKANEEQAKAIEQSEEQAKAKEKSEDQAKEKEKSEDQAKEKAREKGQIKETAQAKEKSQVKQEAQDVSKPNKKIEAKEDKVSKVWADRLKWKGTPIPKGNPQWQRLDPDFTAFVYAAHYDDVENPPVVRVVGFAAVSLKPIMPINVTCLYYGPGNPASTSGSLYHFRRPNNRKHIGAFVDCLLPKNYHHFPTALSIFVNSTKINNNSSSNSNNSCSSSSSSCSSSSNNNATVLNYLNIHYSHSEAWKKAHTEPEALLSHLNTFERINALRAVDPGWRWNITRCTPAIQRGYDKYQELLEMVAASMAVGVEHFVFYVLEAGPNVLRLLQALEAEGIAEIHPWNLQISQMELLYAGQFSHIQDCLYRNLWSSRYVLFGDMDELFMPRNSTTLLPTLEKAFKMNPRCACQLFRNTFFNRKYPTFTPPTDVDQSGITAKHALVFMTHIRREKAILYAGSRSKPAVDPHRTEIGSVHIINKARKGFTEYCALSSSEGLLHHYRYTLVSNNTVDDPHLWGFGKEVLAKVNKLNEHYQSIHDFNTTLFGLR